MLDPQPRPFRLLITGGAGFIGSNLGERLAQSGHSVIIYDSLTRPGSERNLSWLIGRFPGLVSHVRADIRDGGALAATVQKVDAVFHLAAQVAVTTSMADPVGDFSVNINGTLLLLEALRQRRNPPPMIFASTNKVYGDLADVALALTGDAYVPLDAKIRACGIGEGRSLDFRTPYGCSKGGADQYVLDYARSFGIPTAVLRMSCIYGPRQMGTEDQGWVAHFALCALNGRPISIFGDGCQVRDVLDVSDAVDAYVGAWRNIDRVRGRAFNLGGGPDNAISLRQLLGHLETMVGHPIRVDMFDWRAGDQKYYVSDTRAVRQALGLRPQRQWREGVAALVRWLAADRDLPQPRTDVRNEERAPS